MPEVIYYDGDCGLCHRWVTFVLKRDKTGEHFDFSPIQSDYFSEHVPEAQRAELPDSIIVQKCDATLLVKSNAALYILKQLGGVYTVLAAVGRVVPQGLRDWVYDRIAATRHTFFKKPDDACPMMPPELRSRFHF